MKKNYVKPITEICHVNMSIQVMSSSPRTSSVTGDIGGETNIGYGGSADNDERKDQGGDAKAFSTWNDKWEDE